MNQYVRDYRNKVLDEDLIKVKEEQGRWQSVISSLELSIEAQFNLILQFQALITNLDHLINTLGDILGPSFIERIKAQIHLSQDTISRIELDISDARLHQNTAKLINSELQVFVDDLEKLKKKDVDDGLIFIFVNEKGERINKMNISIDKNGFVKIDSITDKAGNPAKVDGVPQWKTEGDDIALLSPSEDGMILKVDAKGPLGQAKLFCEVDADLGEGVKTLKSNELELIAEAGEASEVKISEA